MARVSLHGVSLSGTANEVTVTASAGNVVTLSLPSTVQVTNLGIGTTTIGTSGAGVLTHAVGTAPTTSPASLAQMWVADQDGVVDMARFHMRDEAGNTGPIAFLEPKVNLFSNTGWGVWSNSTLENEGAALKDDDAADDDTGDWTTSGIETLAFDTDHYEIDSNGSGKMTLASASYTAGKLYQISVDIKDGTASSETLTLLMNDGADQNSPTKTTTGSFVTHTFVFEAATTTASGTVGLDDISDTAASNIEVKNFTLYEVVPGCVGANALGPDLWSKDSGLDVHRQHNDASLTKDGEFYSLKVTKGINGIERFKFTPTGAAGTEEFYQLFAGRTMTIGAWAHSVTAVDNVGISYHDGSSWTDSAVLITTADTFIWMESTFTLSASASGFLPAFHFTGDTSDVAYISQPIMVYGSSIGEGNYSPPPDNVVMFEASAVTSTTLHSLTGQGDISTVTLNLEADSNGVIPKGVAGFWFRSRTNDSASAGTTCNLVFVGKDGGSTPFGPNGLANDITKYDYAYMEADASGDIDYAVTATGGDTFDITLFHYVGVKLR